MRTVVEPVAAEHGLDVDDIEVIPAGRRSLLRITLDGDGPQGTGPDLDQIAAATRAISAVLDDSPAVGSQPYTLEVSSRGVNRPLSRPAHWRRNRGHLVGVTLTDGTRFTGRILVAGEDNVVVDVAGEERTTRYAQIRRAVVQVELNRPSDIDEADGLDTTDASGVEVDQEES